MRSVVLIRGLLRGMGHEVPCEMLAIKESQSGGRGAAYSRCSVIEAPGDLPDGDYTVAFDGGLVTTKKEAGLWVPDGATAKVESSPEESRTQSASLFGIDEGVEGFPFLKNRVA